MTVIAIRQDVNEALKLVTEMVRGWQKAKWPKNAGTVVSPQHRTRPLPASSGRTPVAETVGALRAQIAVVLSELDMPDPDVMLTYETMYGFTWGLQEAVKACELPPEENVDDEAYQKLHRLAKLAQALSEAAGTTAAHISRRISDRNKALGNFPYHRYNRDADRATPTATPMEGGATPGDGATA